ncbi:MAG: OmpA family protein [Myxococcales bacterium]|nr:OmpA family protein [Myxococcales bacterium]MCB9671276.1 OmpA family protein [Alphaproteobacteria bacterium]
MPSSRSLLSAALVLCIPALLAGKGKCRRDPEPTDTITDDTPRDPPPDPEVRIQVVSVAPSSLEPGVRTPLKVYGAGFQEGVAVKVGTQPVEGVKLDDPNTLSVASPALAVGVYDVVVTNPNGKSATLRAGVRVVAEVDDTCRRMAMYFELDAAGLSTSARSALDAALPCLQRQSQIRLEGHADERGTTDYNLALGQRRALAVQDYLVSRGIPPHRLPVVSYGEERPADASHDEAAWAKNRRVEMVAQ